MTDQPGNADVAPCVVFAMDESAPAGDVLGALARLLIAIARGGGSEEPASEESVPT